MVLSGDKKYFEINNRTILGFTDCEDKKSLKLRDELDKLTETICSGKLRIFSIFSSLFSQMQVRHQICFDAEHVLS